MYIEGMYGLGDNIYQRAFIKNIKTHVYLRTPWVELYQDLKHVSFIKPDLGLRTQSKHILSLSPTTWTNKQKFLLGHPTHISYGKSGIMEGMRKAFRCNPDEMDLPDFSDDAPRIDGKYVVVRPVTVRKEWLAQSRNCLPEYIAHAAQVMRERGYKIVSVADLEDGKEWALDPLPEADIIYHRGELALKSLLGLVKNASLTIGAVGWILPACLALKTPLWLVFGGYGAYNSPNLIMDKRFVDTSRIGCAIPDNFCLCDKKDHLCNKRISYYEQKFADWLEQQPFMDA